jgi:hypothetical protein
MERKQLISRESRKALTSEFKKDKLSLQEKNYPQKETKEFVLKYVGENLDYFLKRIPEDSIIFITPSSTRINQIPYHFGKLLEKNIPGLVVIDERLYAKPKHSMPAKERLLINQREKELIDYNISIDNHYPQFKDRKKYILDDFMGSGESVVNLDIRLQQKGIHVDGYISLLATKLAYTTETNIKRIHERLSPLAPNKEASDNLYHDIGVYLKGYLSTKATRVIFSLNHNKTKTVYESISKIAANQRRNGLFKYDEEKAREIFKGPERKI